MNRPPHKKTLRKDELSRDPRFDQKDLEEAKITSQDDRNLVGVDDAFKEADVEDKLWLFWEKNKNTMILAAVVALVAAAGVQVWRIYEQQAFTAMQREYQVAMEDPATGLQAFGGSHAGKPLGGFALLLRADAFYADGDFVQAAALYAQAQPGLAGLPFADRARLGRGMALVKGGNQAEGVVVLTELARSTTVLQAIRGEAAFDLALLALADNRPEEARQWLAVIDSLTDAPAWEQQAMMLRENSIALSGES